MAKVEFLDKGIVTVGAKEVLKPSGLAWEAKGWGYVYTPLQGSVQIVLKLPDGSQIELANAEIELKPNQVGFIAVRTQVTIKDKSEMPRSEAKEL